VAQFGEAKGKFSSTSGRVDRIRDRVKKEKLRS